MASPTSHSLTYLRRLGFTVAIVERWVERLIIRMDVWHFADLLACHPARREIILVQTTTAPNLAARIAKTKRQPELAIWLAAGGKVQLHGWRRVDGRWHVRVVEVQAGDLAAVEVATMPRKRRRSRWQPGELFDPQTPAVAGAREPADLADDKQPPAIQE